MANSAHQPLGSSPQAGREEGNGGGGRRQNEPAVANSLCRRPVGRVVVESRWGSGTCNLAEVRPERAANQFKTTGRAKS